MTEKPSSDADKSIQGVPAESKFPNVLRLPTISAKLNEPRLVEKKVGLGQVAPVPELNFFSCDIPAPELMVLAISDISVGEQILPVNAPTVEAFKESFSIERQVVPILVRKHQDGHFELLSGIAEIQALSELGQTEVLATVVSGLTDLDARFLEVTSSIHPKLSVLDRTLLHDRLEAVMKETKASQHETAVQTNRDLSVRKIAEHFGQYMFCRNGHEMPRADRPAGSGFSTGDEAACGTSTWNGHGREVIRAQYQARPLRPDNGNGADCGGKVPRGNRRRRGGAVGGDQDYDCPG